MPLRTYKEIKEKLESDIVGGKLYFGAPLPPTREMAQKMGVSRDTVVRAYSLLKDLGYIESEGRRGTFVIYKVPEPKQIEPALKKPVLSQFGKIISEWGNIEDPIVEDEAFNFSAVPKDALPMRRWKEFLAQYVKGQNPDYIPDIFGREPFRESLVKYLAHSRDIHSNKENIAVLNISLTAVDILFKLLLEQGDTIAVEKPGYSNIVRLAQMHQLTITQLPVDQDGASVELLSGLKQSPKLIYLTPDSHDPSGAKLSLKRRLEVLDWAKTNDAFIIEDAFDSWFRYGKAAPPSLKSLDTEGRVFYLSTFWQILYPLVTTSFLVMPTSFINVFCTAKGFTAGVAETIPQEFLSDMIDSGYLNGHVRRWNKTFAARRRSLIFNLTQNFGQEITIPSYSAGLHCLLKLGDYHPTAVIRAAENANLPLRHIEENQYICYFAGLEESAIKSTVRGFRTQLKK